MMKSLDCITWMRTAPVPSVLASVNDVNGLFHDENVSIDALNKAPLRRRSAVLWESPHLGNCLVYLQAKAVQRSKSVGGAAMML